jgi:acetyl coenzyme A synthetase (ADP forming)-like protein
MSAVAPYPSTEAADIALRDGSSVHVRPVVDEDRDAIRAFLEGLSEESIVYRFFGIPSLPWAVNWSVDVDYADRYAIVAESGAQRTIVAHAAYMRTGERSAEVAFMVADAIQGQGIASLMLIHLAAVAARHGIERFTAEVMGANHKMTQVFRNSGFPVTMHTADAVTTVELPTALCASALEAFDRREQSAATSAVRGFLAPRSVAVVGASRRPGAVGGELLRKVLDGGFTGTVYAVNPHEGTIRGLPAYRSVAALPGPVELAIVTVPAEQVADVAAECAAAGVSSLLVVSAGFGEAGEKGRRRQRELLRICRLSGMRLIGPNCLGVVNTDPEVCLDATFAARTPPAGRVAFLSQSGGLGIALIEAAARLGLGLSTFVSVGNKADISGNDLLEFWEHDPATELILLYLESFGNPRRFARIARRVSRCKPILAVKSGRSPAGARATSSHTGALLSASDVTVDALFRQAGVIRTDTIGELLDTAALLAAQPVPRGRRVAIITNGGGPGILCADACDAAGLDVVELSDAVRAELTGFLPAGASVGNPIDMIATATAEDYRRAIEVITRSDAVDAVITLFVPPLMTDAGDVMDAITRAAECAGALTLAAVFMDRDLPAGDGAGSGSVPRFAFPEDAVRALAHAVRYAEWRARPIGEVVEPDGCRRRDADAVIARALTRGAEWLAPDEAGELLACYRLPLIPTRVVRTEREAIRAAAEFGGPVALKATAVGLLHKSDCGAVRLGLKGDVEVRAAARAIRRAVTQAGHRLGGFVVQPMASDGVELLLGVVHDESFGPVIACGAGGTAAELLGDVAVRITPLTERDADEMLSALRIYPLLRGYRGSAVCDVEAVGDAMLRLSALVEAHPEIVELDANPVIVGPQGAMILDARVRVGSAAPVRPLGSLRG